MTATAQRTPLEDKSCRNRQVAWRERNPQAQWAHAALGSGLRRALVTRQLSAVCREPRTEAPHLGYDRPLVVGCLCRAHRKARHADEKRGVQE